MAERTSIRVDLDTKLAVGKFKDLAMMANVANWQVSKNLGASVTGPLASQIGPSAAVGQLVSPTSSAFGAIMNEMTEPLAYAIRSYMLDDLATKAEGSKAARSQIQDQWALAVGLHGDSALAGAKRHYDAIYPIMQAEAVGRERIMSSDQFREVKPMEVVDHIMKKLEELWDSAMQSLKEAIWPF
jgi:hypothetical protein